MGVSRRNYCCCFDSIVSLTVLMCRCKQNISIICVCMLLYSINRFWLKDIICQPVIGYILKCHFNDFLAGIVILAYINCLLSLSRYRNVAITSYLVGILITCICGLLWEYCFPVIFSNGVTDFYDLIAYVLGGITYITILSSLRYYNKKGK